MPLGKANGIEFSTGYPYGVWMRLLIVLITFLPSDPGPLAGRTDQREPKVDSGAKRLRCPKGKRSVQSETKTNSLPRAQERSVKAQGIKEEIQYPELIDHAARFGHDL